MPFLQDSSCSRLRFLAVIDVQKGNFLTLYIGVCDLMILDRERLECVHDSPLHRDRLHHASGYILSVAVLGSDIQPNRTICCSVLFHATHKCRQIN